MSPARGSACAEPGGHAHLHTSAGAAINIDVVLRWKDPFTVFLCIQVFGQEKKKKLPSFLQAALLLSKYST